MLPHEWYAVKGGELEARDVHRWVEWKGGWRERIDFCGGCGHNRGCNVLCPFVSSRVASCRCCTVYLISFCVLPFGSLEFCYLTTVLLLDFELCLLIEVSV